MEISEIKLIYEWFLLRACVASLAVLATVYLLLKLGSLIGTIKHAARRYGWSFVLLFAFCSAWATYTAFPTAEEKNRCGGVGSGGVEEELRKISNRVDRVERVDEAGSVANVGMLPITNTNCQLGNGERGMGNLELENGTGNIRQNNIIAPATLNEEDFARGFVLMRIGTNEVYDFTAPEGASICEDWKAFGAAEDWIYLEGSGVSSQWLGHERLRVHSDGWTAVLSSTSTVFVAKEYFPFKSPLGIVPEANWGRISYNRVGGSESDFSRKGRKECVDGEIEENIADPQIGTNIHKSICENKCGFVDCNGSENLHVSTRSTWLNSSPYNHLPSLFWHYLTPSNTLQLTWQNALYNRESDMPISFQVEFYENGDFTYRYDLSAIKSKVDSGVIPENFPSNITIGTTSSSFIPHSSSLIPHLASLFFRRLDPTDTPGGDLDGDGLAVEDELFIYHTDPYNADSDYDGLSDYDEIFIVKSNPLDAYSISDDYYDGFASALKIRFLAPKAQQIPFLNISFIPAPPMACFLCLCRPMIRLC